MGPRRRRDEGLRRRRRREEPGSATHGDHESAQVSEVQAPSSQRHARGVGGDRGRDGTSRRPRGSRGAVGRAAGGPEQSPGATANAREGGRCAAEREARRPAAQAIVSAISVSQRLYETIVLDARIKALEPARSPPPDAARPARAGGRREGPCAGVAGRPGADHPDAARRGYRPKGSSPEGHSAALESPGSVKFAERHQTDRRPTAERALESPNWSGRRCRRGHPLAGQRCRTCHEAFERYSPVVNANGSCVSHVPAPTKVRRADRTWRSPSSRR